jgi:hypothetical protein
MTFTTLLAAFLLLTTLAAALLYHFDVVSIFYDLADAPEPPHPHFTLTQPTLLSTTHIPTPPDLETVTLRNASGQWTALLREVGTKNLIHATNTHTSKKKAMKAVEKWLEEEKIKWKEESMREEKRERRERHGRKMMGF